MMNDYCKDNGSLQFDLMTSAIHGNAASYLNLETKTKLIRDMSILLQFN